MKQSETDTLEIVLLAERIWWVGILGSLTDNELVLSKLSRDSATDHL